MLIKNFDQLATTPLRKTCLEIINTGLESVQPENALEAKVKLTGNLLTIDETNFDLANFENIFVVGIGKASFKAARFLDNLLGDRIKDGIIIDVEVSPLAHIRTFTGTHPLPSQQNLEATTKIIELLQNRSAKDLVIAIISGGGSVLLCQPTISLEQLIELNSSLLKSGADIQEMNTIRKHISKVHGGNLAKLANPATVIGLIFSDVPFDDTSFIASGPTFLDVTTISDAQAIFEKYHIQPLPLTETPKDQTDFAKVSNFLIVSNQTGLEAMFAKAKQLGLTPTISSHTFKSDANSAGQTLLSQLFEDNSVILTGGETTVTVTGNGKGGRNQQTVLASLQHLKDNQIIISVASDGKDNIKDAAGAVGDSQTIAKAKDLNLDASKYLTENDSYNFFAQTNDLIITDITGTNVSDFFLVAQK